MKLVPHFDQVNHDHLLETTIERIEIAYSNAVKKGIERPAIFLLDVRDDLSQEILYLIERGPDLEKLLVEADRQPSFLIFTLYVPTEAAIKFIPKDYQAITSVLRNWPTSDHAGRVPVVVVDVEMVTVVEYPIPEL